LEPEERRRRPQRAEQRRNEVIERAAELFDHDGYFQTSLDDVAAAVGLRKATLYHYFSGKDEILSSIHEEVLSFTASREDARAQYHLPPQHHLLEIIADTLEVIARRRGHIRVFVEHFRELDPAAQAAIAKRRAAYTARVEAVVREGIEAGVFREMNTRIAVLALFGVCNWAYQWLGEDDEPRETAYALWDLVMRGLASEPPPPPKG
jgi:AcrR family transcriptional regulator